jgi:hypothetical protein
MGRSGPAGLAAAFFHNNNLNHVNNNKLIITGWPSRYRGPLPAPGSPIAPEGGGQF